MSLAPIYFRVAVRHFMPRLLPMWFAVLLLVSQLDAVTRWTLLREQLAASDPIKVAMAGTFLLGTWALGAGIAMRGVLDLGAMRWLLRQPVSPNDLSWAALLAILPAAPPALGWIWLCGIDLAGTLPLAVSLLISTCALIWMVARGAHGMALLCMLGLATTLALTQIAWIGALISAIAWVTAAPVFSRRLRVTAFARPQKHHGGFAPRGEISAQVYRHMLCWWRCHRSDMFSHWLLCAMAIAFMGALRFNGQLPAHQLWIGFTILLAILSVSTFGQLSAIAQSIGAFRLLDPRWPVSSVTRLVGLELTAAISLGVPALVMIAICGSPSASFMPLALANLVLFNSLTVATLLLGLWRLPNTNAVGLAVLFAGTVALAVIGLPWLTIPAGIAGTWWVSLRLLRKRACIHG